MANGVKTGGRQKGTPNKATADVRAAIALLMERNIGKLEQWIGCVADGDAGAGIKPDPGKAADLLLRAAEYHIPKLGRIDHAITGRKTMREYTREELMAMIAAADGR